MVTRHLNGALRTDQRRKRPYAVHLYGQWEGRLYFFFLITSVHDLHDFPPFPPYVQQMVPRGLLQHSSQVSYSADWSRFVCWKDRLSRAHPRIWVYNLHKAAQLVSEPLTVKSVSYDSHYFHPSDENIQSEPCVETRLLRLPRPLYT